MGTARSKELRLCRPVNLCRIGSHPRFSSLTPGMHAHRQRIVLVLLSLSTAASQSRVQTDFVTQAAVLSQHRIHILRILDSFLYRSLILARSIGCSEAVRS